MNKIERYGDTRLYPLDIAHKLLAITEDEMEELVKGNKIFHMKIKDTTYIPEPTIDRYKRGVKVVSIKDCEEWLKHNTPKQSLKRVQPQQITSNALPNGTKTALGGLMESLQGNV